MKFNAARSALKTSIVVKIGENVFAQVNCPLMVGIGCGCVDKLSTYAAQWTPIPTFHACLHLWAETVGSRCKTELKNQHAPTLYNPYKLNTPKMERDIK